MDSSQEQAVTLSIKVDALHQIVEQLNERTSEILSTIKVSTGNDNRHSQSGSNAGRYSIQSRSSYEIAMEHKDVLADNDYTDSDSQSGDRAMTPEIQIQRLTAQLTAAYNRIAALEEQLLSRRIH